MPIRGAKMKRLLKMDRPAREWEEAYPIGNGRLGAMIMGGAKSEQVFLNEDTLWYGGDRDCHNPDTPIFLDEIRALLFNGEISKATKLAKMAMTSTPKYMNPYQPLGHLSISFEGLAGEIESYKRELNLDEAMSQVSYSHQGTHYTRAYLVSYPDQVIAMQFKAEGEGKLTFALNMNRRPFDVKSGKYSEDTLCVQGQSGPEGVHFMALIGGKVQGGSIKTIGDFVYVEEAQEVEIYVSVGTSFRGEDYKEQAIEAYEQAKNKGFERVKANHIEDYQKIYNKNQLTLSEMQETPITQQLMDECKEGKREEAAALAELFYAYGKYLIIASSREGALPANLQGIWSQSFMPAWECNYTININLQMNYWLTCAGNLIECQQPLIDFIKRLCERGKETARRLYGCEGAVAHHTSNMWAQTTPGGIFAAAPFWPMGLAWLSLHLCDHYHYTQDEQFLKEVCLPILEEVGKFYKGYLVKSPEGYLVTGPSLSPENSYKAESGEVGALCMGPSMDAQIIRQVMTEYINLSQSIGVDSDEIESFKKILGQLPAIRVGKHGQLMEWYKDYEEAEPGHRHMSHLFALHPANQITKEETPELFEAAKVTLKRRLEHGGGHTGWSMAWMINFYARLLQPEDAYNKLLTLMTKQAKCNLFTVHPPFQIDGNLGGCSGIAEMLIQSHEEMIRILPALPQAWQKGSAKGFLARGGIEVSFQWASSQVQQISLIAKKNTTCTVLLPDGEKLEIELEGNRRKIIDFNQV